MCLDNIKELLSGRRSSSLVLVVSDLEVPEVSVIELIGPNLLCGRIVLLTGASPSPSITSVLCPGSLELCGRWVTGGTDTKRASRLEGTQVDSVGSFVVSSLLNTPLSKSSTSSILPCQRAPVSKNFWRTRFNQPCPSMLSK